MFYPSVVLKLIKIYRRYIAIVENKKREGRKKEKVKRNE